MLINTTQNDDTNVGVWTAESGSLPMHKVLVMTKQKECQLWDASHLFILRPASTPVATEPGDMWAESAGPFSEVDSV